MAYIPRSSLIPAEASGAIPVQMKRKRTVHAFGLIATIIFILSLLAAVGVFLYKDYLEGQLATAQQELSSVKDEDTSRKIAEVRRHDEKLRAAKQLLDNHISPLYVFEEIEGMTKQTVQFTSLEFIYDPGFEAVLTLSGDTREFSSIALQKMQILADEVFSEFVLQDIATSKGREDTEGNLTPPGVTFRVTGVFMPEKIAYTGENGVPMTDAVPAPSVFDAPPAGETSADEEATSDVAGEEGADESDTAPVVAPPAL